MEIWFVLIGDVNADENTEVKEFIVKYKAKSSVILFGQLLRRVCAFIHQIFSFNIWYAVFFMCLIPSTSLETIINMKLYSLWIISEFYIFKSNNKQCMKDLFMVTELKCEWYQCNNINLQVM